MDAATPLTRGHSAWSGALFFLALALVVTWPLAPGLGRDVPSDYGDPLYAAWAIAWVSRQLGRIFSGDVAALLHFFDANQLHPEPATLALSDHFVGQALPLAPVYWLTQDAVLTLGLAYLVAFWLCGFCMWLLVREITGSALAGVLAGSVFAFNEFFTIYELAHLQILSAHWMPLALYGLRRYFAHDETRGLAIAAVSVILLNLSSGYYLVMFPPFVLLYVGWELTTRARWTHGATWRHLLVTGAAVALVTAPFVWPYLQAQQRLGFRRTIDETTTMSATVDGYLDSARRLFAAYLCAGIALVGAVVARLRARATSPVLLWFAVAASLLAFWMSLGPLPRWGTETYPALGLYGVLQDSVPGMSAVRVTSRFAVVFLVFLSMLAGHGAAMLARVRGVGPVTVMALAASAILLSVPRPFPLNHEDPTAGVNPPPPSLTPGGPTPAVYRYLRSLPDTTVVAELPFADLWYNTRYLLFSTVHWHPLVNGFTSFFPPAYIERVRWLVNPVRTPDEAWQALRSGETTHVVVHTGAWDEAYVQQLDEWLVSRGARSHGTFDGAIVYELPPDRSPALTGRVSTEGAAAASLRRD
jgi:hypothetical protein